MSMDMPGGYLGQGGQKSNRTLPPAESVSGFVYGTADEDARRYGVTRRMYVPPTDPDHYSWGMGTPAGAITTFNDAGRSYSTLRAEQELQKLRRQSELYDTMRLGVPYDYEIRDAVAEEMRRRGHSDEEIRSYRVSMAEADLEKKYAELQSFFREVGSRLRGKTDSAVGQPGAPNPQQYGTAVAVLGPDGKLLPDPQREQAVQARIARAMNGEGMAPGPGSGTLDPASQPTVRNADGTVSTVRTIGIEVDGKHVLIPTVSPDGKVLSDEQAIELFRSSGKHLGVFNSREESDAAGRALSQQEARRVGSSGTVGMAPMTAAQRRAIRMAEERPTAGQIVGPVANRLRDAQVQSDANWQASNSILDTGARLAAENPDIADQMRNKAAGAAMDYGLEAARQGRQWDQDYNRLIAVQTDPNGAMMFEQYQLGQIPGYQITSNPNVSPYWKKLVAEEPIGRNPARYGNIVREGTASRAGRPVGQLQSEAMSQMTRAANRMAEGRGGRQYRDAMVALEAAMASGDENAVTAAEANLKTLLGPMLDKFDARFNKEAGSVGIDIRQQFMDTIKARISAGAAGMASARGQPLNLLENAKIIQYGGPSAGVRGPQPPSASRPTAGGTRGTQPAAPTPPRRTPDGLAIHEYDSVESVIDSVKKGTANIRSGEMVVIGGRPMTAIPSTNRFGEPEMAFVEASVFGGVAVPDPTEFGSQEEWGANLTDRQRQAILDQVATDPAMRGSLGRDTLEQLDRVRRSRQGVLSQRMRPQDREAAIARLKAEEDAALYAAVVGGVNGQARNKAVTSISAAYAADEARRIEALDRTSEQGRRSEALKKAADQAPLHREAIVAAYGEEGAMPDDFVSRSWSRLGDGERAMLDDMLGVFANMQVEGEDMSPEELGAMQYLPVNTLRRVIRSASQGASPVDLAAMIEAERPGFIQEYFGGNVQMTSEVSQRYSQWSKGWDKLRERWANNKATTTELVNGLMEQHSYMLVRYRIGQLSSEERAFFESLPPEAQADPAKYAEAVMAKINSGGSSSQAATSESSATPTQTAPRPEKDGPRPMSIRQQMTRLAELGFERELRELQDRWESMTEEEKRNHLREVAEDQRRWDELAPVTPKPEPPAPPPQEREIIRRMEDRRTRRTPATPSGMPFGGGQSLVGNNPKM
jgi:hypothetical protein